MSHDDAKITFPCLCCQKCGYKFGWIGRLFYVFHRCDHSKDEFEMAKIHAMMALTYWSSCKEDREFVFKSEDGKFVRLGLKKME